MAMQSSSWGVIEKGRLSRLQLAGMLGDLQERFDKGVDLLTILGIAEEIGAFSFKQRIEKRKRVYLGDWNRPIRTEEEGIEEYNRNLNSQ